MRSEQEKLNGLFIQTCKKQNPSLLNVMSLLEAGANVNARDSHRKTGLMWACIKGHEGIIPYLLTMGAIVNTSDSAGNTPLMMACMNDKPHVIHMLLGAGARVNTVRPQNGGTALMVACVKNRVGVVKVLLEAGADIDAKDSQGRTVFSFYAKNRPNILKLLYAKKYNTMSPTNKNIRTNGAKVIQKAFRQKQLDKELLEECNKENPDISTVRNLLEKGANPNMKWVDMGIEDSLLTHACSLGELEVIKLLLRYGANVNFRSKDGYTALLWALSDGAGLETEGSIILKITKLLLRSGAKVNVSDTAGETPLMAACVSYGKEDKIIKFLIDRGAKINASDNFGHTPLLAACGFGSAKTVKLLIDHGAKINVQNNRGYTPLLYCLYCVSGDQRMYGADRDKEDNAFKVVQLLVRHGANIQAKTEDGKNALQLSTGIIRKYLEKLFIERNYKTMGNVRLSMRNIATRSIQKAFRERLQPQIRRKKAAIVIQRHVRQLPRIKAARTIQSVVRRHYATNRNSQLSKNAITLERIPRRNSIALNGQMYHRNSVASLVALGNARVPHSRRRIVTGANGRYTTA